MHARYDPITHRTKHTLRELEDDPWNWLEGPEHGPRAWGRYSAGRIAVMAAIVAWVAFFAWIAYLLITFWRGIASA